MRELNMQKENLNPDRTRDKTHTRKDQRNNLCDRKI